MFTVRKGNFHIGIELQLCHGFGLLSENAGPKHGGPNRLWVCKIPIRKIAGVPSVCGCVSVEIESPGVCPRTKIVAGIPMQKRMYSLGRECILFSGACLKVVRGHVMSADKKDSGKIPADSV